MRHKTLEAKKMKSLTLNNLGEKYLVEDCHKVRIEALLKSYRGKFKELALTSELQVSGWDIELATSKTYRNGIRLWLKCPLCEKRIGVLFKHPLTEKVGCRQCLNLEYRKRRYRGMLETGLLNK